MSRGGEITTRDGESEGCGFLEPAELEALLEGCLPEERLRRFETHLAGGCASCALLSADAEAFAAALREEPSVEERAGAEADREAVREELRRQRQKNRPLRGRWGWAVAGMAAAAILTAVLVLSLPIGTSPEAILVELRIGETYDAGLLAFSAPPIVRGAPDESPAWEAAGLAYRSGDFKEAAGILATITSRGEDSSAHLYRGVALLAIGEDESALEALGRGQEIASREFLPDGALRWYRSAALLRLGRDAEARPVLAKLAASDLVFAEDARELLDRLEAGKTGSP